MALHAEASWAEAMAETEAFASECGRELRPVELPLLSSCEEGLDDAVLQEVLGEVPPETGGEVLKPPGGY